MWDGLESNMINIRMNNVGEVHSNHMNDLMNAHCERSCECLHSLIK